MSRQIILNFHGVGTPHDEIDAAERPYWIGEDFFAGIVARTASRADVIYTFDDGNLSDLDVAAPILAKHGRTGGFFVLAGRLNQPHYLTPEDVRSLGRMGMEIGLHGRHHLDWRKLDDSVLADETIAAREVLAEAAGHPISGVAIPFGAYNRRVVSHLVRCRFGAIYTSDAGAADGSDLIRNRTSIRSDMTMATIDAIVADRGSAKIKAKRALSTFARRHLL